MKPAVPQRPARPRSAARGPRASLFCPRAPGGAGNHPTPAGKIMFILKIPPAIRTSLGELKS